MRHIQELLEANNEDLPEIYCDMDQVLCNFLKGADKVVGEPFVNADKEKRWNTISNTKDFWANLEWMPGAEKLYRRIEKYDPHILSAYSPFDKNCIKGKELWIKRNLRLSDFSRIHLVRRAEKKAYSNGNILIDDFGRNVKEWKSGGGIPNKHKTAKDTISALKKLGFK